MALDTFDVLDIQCDAWVVTDLELRAGYVGAVAYEGQRKPLAIETHLI